ncbi:DegT/DnrJ/EryC1/StrS family aminotransferase, partial [Candidatus Parcubacteria bacterium]|nr:DegT/DnrJ/EryC1/StrS family aminotransferase [Candidatus Parcubacteria bacterium]
MIPVSKPIYVSGEKENLIKSIDSGWISSEGPFVKEFEKSFSRFIGTRFGIAVSSGTSALEIAMGAIGIKKGDEVIMPDFTIMSCALAVVNYGGLPVFVDAEPETWNMDVSKIEEKITKHTKAILVVHMYGHPSDMGAIMKLAKKYKLRVIEDAAEAHGAEYKGKKCGSFGDISCFSFYSNKIINTGEGGMVLTSNKKLEERCRTLRNLAFIKKRRFMHEEFARNYRLTALQAAVGVAQVKNAKILVAMKRKNAAEYTKRLKDIPGLQLPAEKEWAKNVYWMYGLVLDKSTGFTADSFAKKMAEKGIETRPFFYPLHLQPVWKKENIKIKKGEYPVSKNL